MSLLTHAERELDVIGLKKDDTDEMNSAMRKHILHTVDEFAKEGHSGFSAAYAAQVLNKLFSYQPLAPLTGEDSEWIDVADISGGWKLFQNKRCSRVFKDETGAWDIDGKIFVEPDGMTFTNKDSKVMITFPYTPKTEYVQVPFATEDEETI